MADERAAGGILSEADFSAYDVRFGAAQRTVYGAEGATDARTIYTAVPPAGGAAMVAQMLSVLQPLHALRTPPAANVTRAGTEYHQLVEAMKFAFGERTQLGDPLFYNISSVYPAMIGAARVDAVRARITPRTHNISYYLPGGGAARYMDDDHGTSHFSVMDDAGNAVALTTTVNLVFGSMFETSDGVLMNDQMNDFTVDPTRANAFGIPPSKSNEIAPHKRPLSSIAPLLVMHPDEAADGVEFALGGSGGPMIVSAVAQVALLLLERKDLSKFLYKKEKKPCNLFA